MRIRQFFSESLHHRLVLYFMLLMMIPISVAGTLIYHASVSEYLTALWHWRKKSSKRQAKTWKKCCWICSRAAKQVAEDHTIQSSPRSAAGS